jgi:YggT family protein
VSLANGRPDWQNGRSAKPFLVRERPIPMLDPVSQLILLLLKIYWWIVIAAVVMSWLIAFNVINLHNNIVRALVRLLDALTEPVFRQIRRVIPVISGLDISPLIVLLGVWFLEEVVYWMVSPRVF